MNCYQLLQLLVEDGKKGLIKAILAAACLSLISCKSENRFSDEEAIPILIQATEGIKIVAYCYPPSVRTAQVSDERRKFLDQKIRTISDQMAKQPSNLQASSKKLLELFENERSLMEASTNWPVVFVERVLLEKEKPSRYLAILQKANQPLDIVLTITSDEKLDEPKAFDLVQSSISHFENFTDEDWRKFKPGPHEVFTEDGKLQPSELQRFVEQSHFVGPPN